LAIDAQEFGATAFYNQRVRSINEDGGEANVKTDTAEFNASVVINAGGLYADKLAGELSKDLRVIPFRGYYAELQPDKRDMVNSHVYGAPDLNFPFLGVHLSKRTDGRVIVGPGAMVAFGREAYDLTSFAGGELDKTLTWPGFWKMMKRPEFRKLIRTEVKKSLMVGAIGEEAMKLMPELRKGDFIKSYAGNRAQLVDRDGNLVDDILTRETEHTIHVLNAVSPGLTCSLPFGRDLAQRAIEKLDYLQVS
jgi:L-2-hydroxyglutarate oxidase